MKEKINKIVSELETEKIEKKVSDTKTKICVSCKNEFDKLEEICPHCGVRNK